VIRNPAAPKWFGGIFQFFSIPKIFKKDGNFENNFECGFFSANAMMALEIL
jgi:hypothetical protein